MAKARKTSIKERALKAWRVGMEMPDAINNIKLVASKSRSKREITVRTIDGKYPATWSYATGNLRRIGA